MREELRSRLLNWKFEQALNYIDDDTCFDVKKTVETLARSFGDSGWFYGDIGFFIEQVLCSIGVEEDDTTE